MSFLLKNRTNPRRNASERLRVAESALGQADEELLSQLERVRRELQRVAAALAFAGLLVTGGMLYGRADLRLTLAVWAAALVSLAFVLRR